MKGHIMENLEQSVPDVSSEAPSAPAEGNSAPKGVSAPQESAPKEAPFHEHPRFKELINQRNEFSQRLQEYEKRFQELNNRIDQPKAQTPEAKLLERLKGIDPEFGSWAEQQHQMKVQLEQKLAAMEQWKASQEANSTKSQIDSSLQKLHSEHKVPESIRSFYEARLEQIAKANPNLTINDLPNVYKEIHDGFSKYMESAKRDALSSYTQSKTKDAAIPAPAKGTSPKPGAPKFEYSKDPYEARAQVVKNALKGLQKQ